MMIARPFWLQRLQHAWREAPIVWLSGARRTGKTTLAKALGDRARFVNCDIPAVEDQVRDPLAFYRDCEHPIIIFDEVHQLRDPSRLLKLGADEFPHLKILATGSSTLAASKKFRDSLTGRKRTVHLTPVLWDELEAFGVTLPNRLLHGGLPPLLLASEKSTASYREWLDSFFARDIQRLFAFRDVDRFNSVFEYLLKQSGGLVDVTKMSSVLGISRPTIESHLRALEITHAVTLLRPFAGGGTKELTRRPKCYGFDTGFVSFARQWNPLRTEDMGNLWEHVFLEYLQAHDPDARLHYWRDSSAHELDFVVQTARDRVDIFECKWSERDLNLAALKVFRSHYPKGMNFIVSPITQSPYRFERAGLELIACNPAGWREWISKTRAPRPRARATSASTRSRGPSR